MFLVPTSICDVNMFKILILKTIYFSFKEQSLNRNMIVSFICYNYSPPILLIFSQEKKKANFEASQIALKM